MQFCCVSANNDERVSQAFVSFSHPFATWCAKFALQVRCVPIVFLRPVTSSNGGDGGGRERGRGRGEGGEGSEVVETSVLFVDIENVLEI